MLSVQGVIYWISPIMLLIAGIGLAIIYFSKKTRWQKREKEKIRENKENTENLREQWTRGEINTEEFDKLTDKLDPIKRRKRVATIMGLIVIGIIIGVSAFSIYDESIIDCNQPVSHYPSWANRNYTLKCETSSSSLPSISIALGVILSAVIITILIVIYTKRKSER